MGKVAFLFHMPNQQDLNNDIYWYITSDDKNSPVCVCGSIRIDSDKNFSLGHLMFDKYYWQIQ